MFAQLVQTRSGMGAHYEVVQDGQVLCEARAGLPAAAIHIPLTQGGRCVYALHGELWADPRVSRTQDGAAQQRESLDILGPDGGRLGRVFYRWTPDLGTHSWYQLELRGRTWDIYEVGLGRKGIKLPVYLGERQAALLEKDAKVKDNLDRYGLYALDEDAMLVSVLFGLYYDFKRWRSAGELDVKKTQTTFTFSLKRAVRGKYDPKFKETCL